MLQHVPVFFVYRYVAANYQHNNYYRQPCSARANVYSIIMAETSTTLHRTNISPSHVVGIWILLLLLLLLLYGAVTPVYRLHIIISAFRP